MKWGIIGALLAGLATVSCSEPGDRLHVKFPPKRKGLEKVRNMRETFSPQLDILFVVDDSGSMSAHQDRLARNITQFTHEIFKNKLIDIHIGVVKSLAYGGDAGVLLGQPNIITNKTPDRIEALRNNILIGNSGDATESMFNPLREALSPRLTKSANKGFYRESASLAVVFITDAVDQSGIKAEELYDDLLDKKGGNGDKLMGYGVFVPTHVTNCRRDGGDWDPARPKKIEKFMKLISLGLGNNTFSLCSDDYKERLAALGQDLSDRIGLFVPLGEIPVPNTIVVKYGDVVIPEDYEYGWEYVSSRNGIYLSRNLDLSKQKKGAILIIDFKSAKLIE